MACTPVGTLDSAAFDKELTTHMHEHDRRELRLHARREVVHGLTGEEKKSSSSGAAGCGSAVMSVVCDLDAWLAM